MSEEYAGFWEDNDYLLPGGSHFDTERGSDGGGHFGTEHGTEDEDNEEDIQVNRSDSVEDDSPPIERKTSKHELREADKRPHLNVVFIGHVDAGKSTTCGNILVLSCQIDARTIEKYEREAKEKNRESWYLAFIMDINEEERAKGKTVEVGRAKFSTEDRRFTILDAPGHKSFVPDMINGAAQADVGVLIISARKGEFETGFEKGGQTREHAMLAKTLGVTQLIVAINKMDDPTCDWDKARYDDIQSKLTPYLKQFYNPVKDLHFLPISGLQGTNLLHHCADPSNEKVYNAKAAEWYPRDKPTLFQLLDSLILPERREADSLRIPLLSGFRDQGVMMVGKVEAGCVSANETYLLMPSRIRTKVQSVCIGDDDVIVATPGENVLLKVLGPEDDQICKGSVLCSISAPCSVVSSFKATVNIVELPTHPPIITAGYSCILHAHTACEEIQILELHCRQLATLLLLEYYLGKRCILVKLPSHG